MGRSRGNKVGRLKQHEVSASPGRLVAIKASIKVERRFTHAAWYNGYANILNIAIKRIK